MTLIRTAFWLSLVVLLLPADANQQENLYKTASNAATHAATFCDRNASVCAKGSEYWGTFKRKLDFGTKLVVELVSERVFGASRAGSAAVTPASNTLTPNDMTPAWRGRQGRSGA